MTAPSARNKSLNSKEDVPRAAPSEASGTKAVVAVIVVPCIVLLNVAAPASDMSKVRAVTSEPPSFPTNSMSASEIMLCILSLSESSTNCAYCELPSNSLTSPLSSALKSILPAASIVKSPELKSISVPSIVMLSTTTPALAVTAPVTPRVPPTVELPLAVRVVKAPVEAELAPIVAPSTVPPLISAVSATRLSIFAVPST